MPSLPRSNFYYRFDVYISPAHVSDFTSFSVIKNIVMLFLFFYFCTRELILHASLCCYKKYFYSIMTPN